MTCNLLNSSMSHQAEPSVPLISSRWRPFHPVAHDEASSEAVASPGMSKPPRKVSSASLRMSLPSPPPRAAPPRSDGACRTGDRSPGPKTRSLRWGEIFGDEVTAAAMIDRLIHHADILSLKGDSYRLKHRDLAGTTPA